MSDTLRTDTLLIVHDMRPEPKVLINHARDLERALNNADASIKRLKKAGDAMAEWLFSPRNLGGDLFLVHQWTEAKEDKT